MLSLLASQQKEAILYLAVRIITFSHTCSYGSNDNMHTTIVHNAWLEPCCMRESEWHYPTAETRCWKATKYFEVHTRWEACWPQMEDSRTDHKLVYEEKSRKAVDQKWFHVTKVRLVVVKRNHEDKIQSSKTLSDFFLTGSYWWSREGWRILGGRTAQNRLTDRSIYTTVKNERADWQCIKFYLL